MEEDTKIKLCENFIETAMYVHHVIHNHYKKLKVILFLFFSNLGSILKVHICLYKCDNFSPDFINEMMMLTMMMMLIIMSCECFFYKLNSACARTRCYNVCYALFL